MTAKREEIKEIVINELINLASDLPNVANLEFDESTHLLAEGSFMDSLTFVSFIIELEATLSDKFKIDISLSDDRAMTRKKSPYSNVAVLVDYIDELVS